jgi:hypothetical protein
VFDIAEFANRGEHSLPVYQMGNNSKFHLAMFDLMLDHPGVVHLHDPSLHHLIAYLFCNHQTFDQYYRLINHWYGFQAVQRVRDWMQLKREGFWDSAYVGEIPFIEPALENARCVIVHSHFAERRVHRRLSHLTTYAIPQLYRNMLPRVEMIRDQRRLVLGAFGVAQKSKQIDRVMRAVAEVNAWLASLQDNRYIELWVVGELDPCSSKLPDLAQSLGPHCTTRFLGRQSEADFLHAMRDVDVCVSLRSPTMGETSAIVSRSLQIGLPTIVNRIGWYAELPECVLKIETEGDTHKSLVEIFKKCLEESYFQTWQHQCLDNAKTGYSFSAMIEQYISIMDNYPASADRKRQSP